MNKTKDMLNSMIREYEAMIYVIEKYSISELMYKIKHLKIVLDVLKDEQDDQD